DIAARARAFGMRAEEVDGQDVRAVYSATLALVERARQKGGPAFLLCDTYRYRGHHVGDIQRSYYRTKAEEEFWMSQRDPIKILADWLIGQQLATPQLFTEIEKQQRTTIEQGVQFALAAPYPDPKEVDQHVYARNSSESA